MPAETPHQTVPIAALSQTLARNRPWKRIAVVIAGTVDRDHFQAIHDFAVQQRAEVVLYDIAASDGFTSPFPAGEDNWLPDLLQEADLRRVGREDLAVLAHDLANEGLLAGVYLTPTSNANDLAALVQREAVDLVLSFLTAGDRRIIRVLEARRHVHVVTRTASGNDWTLHSPLSTFEQESQKERVRLPYLFVLLATFLLARLRNRA